MHNLTQDTQEWRVYGITVSLVRFVLVPNLHFFVPVDWPLLPRIKSWCLKLIILYSLTYNYVFFMKCNYVNFHSWSFKLNRKTVARTKGKDGELSTDVANVVRRKWSFQYETETKGWCTLPVRRAKRHYFPNLNLVQFQIVWTRCRPIILLQRRTTLVTLTHSSASFRIPQCAFVKQRLLWSGREVCLAGQGSHGP